jgi:hypothetical protein
MSSNAEFDPYLLEHPEEFWDFVSPEMLADVTEQLLYTYTHANDDPEAYSVALKCFALYEITKTECWLHDEGIENVFLHHPFMGNRVPFWAKTARQDLETFIAENPREREKLRGTIFFEEDGLRLNRLYSHAFGSVE